MAKLNGTNMRIIAGGVAIAGCKSFTLNTNLNLFDASDKDSAGWAVRGAGQKSWTVDFDGLYDPAGVYNAEELTDLIINRASVTLEMATIDGTGGGQKWTGTAYLESHSLTAPMEDVVTITGTFQGTGALTKGTVTSS